MTRERHECLTKVGSGEFYLQQDCFNIYNRSSGFGSSELDRIESSQHRRNTVTSLCVVNVHELACSEAEPPLVGLVVLEEDVHEAVGALLTNVSKVLTQFV